MNVLLLSAALILAPASFVAQSASQPAQMSAPQDRPATAHKAVVRLARTLNLSADQQARLEPILAERKQKIAALRANTQMPDVERKQQMKAVRQQSRAQMSTVLTPDQMQQVKSMHHAGHAPTTSPTGI